MSYGNDDESTGRLPAVFQRLGSHSLSIPSSTTVSEEPPRHVYSEQPLRPPPAQPQSNMGIRIASRPSHPAYMQPQHYPPPQANPMYLGYPQQASTSPVVLHQEGPYYPSHSAPPMNVHDFATLSSSPSSMSMVPAQENAPTQFVRDIGGIKDPTLNRGQVFSFLGNKQSTPYHYSPYSEEDRQWHNKSNSSSHANQNNNTNRGSSPHGGSQVSSPTIEPTHHRKDPRRDLAKSIQIISYKKQEEDNDAEEHHAVIRKVTMSSTDSRSYSSSSDKNSSRHHEREHSNEDRRNRSRHSSSGSGDRESSYVIRQRDSYEPDYSKRPLPNRATLTGVVRQRHHSDSPDRHRSSRNTSRSPPRNRSNTTNINDRLNLSQVNNAIPTTSTSSTSNGNAESTLYQNKTWVNPSEKLPLSKKFTPKEQLTSPVEPVKSPSDATHKSYNKIWIKPDDATSSCRDLRHREPISSGPLPPSRKFSSGAQTESSKPKEKPKVMANKQKNVSSSKPTPVSSPKVNGTRTTAQSKSPSPVSNTNIATTTVTSTNTITIHHSAADTAAKSTAGASTSAAANAETKALSKELPNCSKITDDALLTSEAMPSNHPIIKEEPDTKEMKLSDFNKSEKNSMDHQVVNNKQSELPSQEESTTMEDVLTEKRSSDTSVVPDLIQSKKRRVSPERNGETCNDAMEIDTVQNESTCSSSANSIATAVSDTHSADTALNKKIHTTDQLNSTGPIPIMTDAVTTDASSCHVPTSARETTLIPSKMSNLSTADEKEDILEQIFGDGYSRDVTPEVTERPSKSSFTGKLSRLNESIVGHDKKNDANTPDTQIKDVVNPSEPKNNVVTPKKENEKSRKTSRRLPLPWIACMSDTGQIFYYNPQTEESSNIRPTVI